MTEGRIPALLEVQGLIRRVQSQGGFAAVISRGDVQAGTLLLLTIENGGNPRVWERLPQSDGIRKWHQISEEHIEKYGDTGAYLTRRQSSDPDLWVVELDVPNAERFIGLSD